jgi:hypothetical protein
MSCHVLPCLANFLRLVHASTSPLERLFWHDSYKCYCRMFEVHICEKVQIFNVLPQEYSTFLVYKFFPFRRVLFGLSIWAYFGENHCLICFQISSQLCAAWNLGTPGEVDKVSLPCRQFLKWQPRQCISQFSHVFSCFSCFSILVRRSFLSFGLDHSRIHWKLQQWKWLDHAWAKQMADSHNHSALHRWLFKECKLSFRGLDWFICAWLQANGTRALYGGWSLRRFCI